MIGTVEQFIAYAEARGVVVLLDEAPVYLVKATDYMDSFEWKGDRPSGQEDSWPRENITVNGDTLFTADGEIITVIEHSDGTEEEIKPGDVIGSPPVTPQPIITATYRVALAIAEGVDVTAVSGGAQVTQETVSGAVSVSYAESTVTNKPVIPGFNSLIADWLAYLPGSGVNFSVTRG